MSTEESIMFNNGTVIDRAYYRRNIKYFECINPTCPEAVVDVERAVDMPNGKCPKCDSLLGMIVNGDTK
jgi:hypothetical protein